MLNPQMLANKYLLMPGRVSVSYRAKCGSVSMSLVAWRAPQRQKFEAEQTAGYSTETAEWHVPQALLKGHSPSAEDVLVESCGTAWTVGRVEQKSLSSLWALHCTRQR